MRLLGPSAPGAWATSSECAKTGVRETGKEAEADGKEARRDEVALTKVFWDRVRVDMIVVAYVGFSLVFLLAVLAKGALRFHVGPRWLQRLINDEPHR